MLSLHEVLVVVTKKKKKNLEILLDRMCVFWEQFLFSLIFELLESLFLILKKGIFRTEDHPNVRSLQRKYNSIFFVKNFCYQNIRMCRVPSFNDSPSILP